MPSGFDGTLWCEKPIPIQADFVLRRLFEMAQADPQLRDRQPWKAAYERDHDWLSTTIVEHYAGDHTKMHALVGGMLAAFGGISVRTSRRSPTHSCTRPNIRRSAAPI